MDGECQPNSQFTRTTEAELKQRASKQKLFSCSGALVVEYNNGRVVVVFTPKDKNGLSVAYAGTYGGASASARNYLETDFDDVDLKELKDIRKIRIDRNQTKEKRIAQYLRQVGNPYLVCIGNVKVKIRFANNGVSFEDAFEELLLSV